MNVYDFDDTIYRGDSTIDFYFFCLRKQPSIIRYLPQQTIACLLYAVKQINTEKFKESFFCFLPAIRDPENMIDAFWNQNFHKIKSWYLEKLQEADLVISASPFFLICPACKRLGISEPIATCMEIKTGKIHGANCKGQEKVRRLQEQYGHVQIEAFFSDSLSDSPLANIAQNAYLVRNDEIIQWTED